jgi:hypothetical protein
MPTDLERLQTIGFANAGHWSVSGDVLVYELNARFVTVRNALYAFVASDRVMYIGKSTQPLRSRIDNYKYATRSTNIKNKTNILEHLSRGTPVEIYVLPDNGLLHYGGFHVNLAAGLEDSLIRELNPPWNGGKKELPDEDLVPIDPLATADESSTSKGAV